MTTWCAWIAAAWKSFSTPELSRRQHDIAHAKGFEIADHALSLYAHCKRSPCPHKSAMIFLLVQHGLTVAMDKFIVGIDAAQLQNRVAHRRLDQYRDIATQPPPESPLCERVCPAHLGSGAHAAVFRSRAPRFLCAPNAQSISGASFAAPRFHQISLECLASQCRVLPTNFAATRGNAPRSWFG